MPYFYIDDKQVEFEPGEKVLSAALRSGNKIPHYCYHPSMSVVATCRMCVVDVVDLGNGTPAPKLQTACSLDAAEGMKIKTHNNKVKEGQKLVNEFLLINHPLDCPICDQSGESIVVFVFCFHPSSLPPPNLPLAPDFRLTFELYKIGLVPR